MSTAARDPISLWPDPRALGTLTDLYQLTMMAGYAAAGRSHSRATFELFVRKLPPNRAYLVLAGLEQAIGDLLTLAFDDRQIEALRAMPVLRHLEPAWFDSLRSLRFDGDLWAIPEGSVVFAGEPLVRVEAELPIAQWVETYLISALAYPTLVASKAARIVRAADGRGLIDFGARRGHGPLSGLLCARASYLAGFDATSHVEASIRLGIPSSGTMAHSWIQSFGDEEEAFRAFVRCFPENATLLVDTYDTPTGVRRAAALEPPVHAIRIDSGDLGTLSREARTILDGSGRTRTRIVASNDLDEWKIRDLIEAGAPIDAFGVGTELITSRDAPALGMVYKLVAVDGRGRVKLSPGKITYPLAKQIVRRRDASNRFAGDHVVAAGEGVEGELLLRPRILGGRLVGEQPSLEEVRDHCRAQRAALPQALHAFDAAPEYPVTYSESLQEEARRLGIAHA